MLEHYELLYIIPVSKYTEEELKPVVEKITGIIEKHGGVNFKQQIIGKRKLAFKIKQANQGFYVALEFDFPQDKLRDLDKELRFHEDVLRHLIIKKRFKTEEEIQAEKQAKVRIETRADKEMAAEIEKEKDALKVDRAEKKVAPKETPKVSLEELDKKLDEILKADNDILDKV